MTDPLSIQDPLGDCHEFSQDGHIAHAQHTQTRICWRVGGQRFLERVINVLLVISFLLKNWYLIPA